MNAHSDLSEAECYHLAAADKRVQDLATLADMIRKGCDTDTMATYMDCTTTEIEDLVSRALPRADRNTDNPVTVARLRQDDPGFDLTARLQAAANTPANSGKIWDRTHCDKFIRLVAASDNITQDIPAIAEALGRSPRSLYAQARHMIPEEHARLKGLDRVKMLWQMTQDDPSYITNYRTQDHVIITDAITKAITAHDPIDVVIAETGLTEDQILKKTIRLGHARTHTSAAALYRSTTPATPPHHGPLAAVRNAIRRLTNQ